MFTVIFPMDGYDLVCHFNCSIQGTISKVKNGVVEYSVPYTTETGWKFVIDGITYRVLLINQTFFLEAWEPLPNPDDPNDGLWVEVSDIVDYNDALDKNFQVFENLYE